ncbi:hypothetical protein C8R43DRAFT_1005067 [Mycena crocata]|nr:hypothetical protein C8R43DRAFT_1005067 [Mycena crocata]
MGSSQQWVAGGNLSGSACGRDGLQACGGRCSGYTKRRRGTSATRSGGNAEEGGRTGCRSALLASDSVYAWLPAGVGALSAWWRVARIEDWISQTRDMTNKRQGHKHHIGLTSIRSCTAGRFSSRSASAPGPASCCVGSTTYRGVREGQASLVGRTS